jgi:hypothetical protein
MMGIASQGKRGVYEIADLADELYLGCMSPGKTYTQRTILFYLIIVPLAIWGGKSYPSGPCTPGLDVLAVLLLPAMAVIGICISVAGMYKGKSSYKGPFFINIAALIGLIIFFSIS